MTIDDIFVFKRHGTVFIGKSDSGSLNIGDVIHVIQGDKLILTTVVVGLDIFSPIGILVHDGPLDQIAKGMIVTTKRNAPQS